MITGAHVIIDSTNPDADRAFLRDVLTLTNVAVGGGWLIFGLPPAEVAVHPSDKNNVHELYFMCDDIEAFWIPRPEKDAADSEDLFHAGASVATAHFLRRSAKKAV